MDRPEGNDTPNRSSIAWVDTFPSVSNSVGSGGRMARDFLVMLVEDLAHQLLQQIFQRCDAQGSAELIEHYREVAPLPLHVEQQVAAGPAGRGDRHGAHRQRVARLELEQVECVQHADDVVQRSADHRNPAVSAAGEDQPDLIQWRILFDRDDVGAWESSLPEPAVR